jgi:hypothetical protein
LYIALCILTLPRRHRFSKPKAKTLCLAAYPDESGDQPALQSEKSSTLGFAMLFMLDIKLDYRDNLIDFEYDPNRIH